MLKIKCDFCKKKIKKPGGLIFSPPVKKITVKIHVCVSCYRKFIKILSK